MDSRVSKENDICVVRWFDNCAVTLASSFVGVEPIDHVRRWSTAGKEFVMGCRPACVQVCNEYMGGVDKLDGLISHYCIRCKTKKWPLRAIYHFVDFALANSRLEYRDIEILNGNRKYHDLFSFRNEVADALLKAKLDPPPVKATNPVGQPRFSTASPGNQQIIREAMGRHPRGSVQTRMYDLINFIIFHLQSKHWAYDVRWKAVKGEVASNAKNVMCFCA